MPGSRRSWCAAWTACTIDTAETVHVSPAFKVAYKNTYPPDLTYEGKARQCCAGGGATGTRPSFADRLVVILVYPKTTPCQACMAYNAMGSSASTLLDSSPAALHAMRL